MNLHPFSLLAGARRHARAVGVVAAIGLAAALPAEAATYNVSFDTSSFAGTVGSVDLQWNTPVLVTALAASVTNFSGALLSGAATVLAPADVSGSFANGATLLFGGHQPFSYIYQTLTFGSTISFTLTLPDAASALIGAASGAVFAVSLYDLSLTPLLGADPFSGASLQFDLAANAAPVVTSYTPAATVAAITAAVPEPSTYALTLLGLLAVVAMRRRSKTA